METRKRTRGPYKGYFTERNDYGEFNLPRSTKSDYMKKFRGDVASENLDNNIFPFSSDNLTSDILENNARNLNPLMENSLHDQDVYSPHSLENDKESFPPCPEKAGEEIIDTVINDDGDVGSDPCGFAEIATNSMVTKGEKCFLGSKLTKTESILLIFGYAIRHKLSNSALQDLLTLINFFLPPGDHVPSSVYLLRKQLGVNFTTAQRHFFCRECEKLLPTGSKVCGSCVKSICKICNASFPGDLDTCGTCGAKNSTKVAGDFFVSFNIQDSLRKVLKRQNIQDSLRRNLKKRKTQDGFISDIWDGAGYKNLHLSNDDLSCCLNTDGASIFNSSKFSLWPILVSLNELDYKLRRKHTFLAGLWWGKGKPKFNLYFDPFIQQAKELQNPRLEWHCYGEKKLSRVIFALFAADSVARCLVQGLHQFNGKYGCPWCDIRGEALKDDCGKQKKWIYNPKIICEKRTHDTFLTHLLELHSKLESGDNVDEVHGVKSASPLLLLPQFNIVKGFTYDYMHGGIIGVLKTFTSALFEPKNHEKSFYIGLQTGKVNKRISNCKFPFECTRTLRSLEDVSYWKASEWKQWMMICTSILEGVLAFSYLQHLSYLTNGLSLLLQDRISSQDLQQASTLIDKFCNLIPELYDPDYFLFNVHILRHAVDCVVEWGPLWCYSLFQFENYNNVLVNSYSGTSRVGEQIVDRIQRSQEVYSQGEYSFENEQAKSYFGSLLDCKRYYIKSSKSGNCTFMGASKPYALNDTERYLLRSFDLEEAVTLQSFSSCLINGKKYRTKARTTTRGCDYIVKVNEKFYEIIHFVQQNSLAFGILFVKRIWTSIDNFGICKFRHKVNSHLNSPLRAVTSLAVENCKVSCYFNDCGKLLYIFPMLNMSELE